MEGQRDGLIAASRCLEAMAETADFETRLALWKAAKRYAAKGRQDFTDTALEGQREALPEWRALSQGGQVGRELEW